MFHELQAHASELHGAWKPGRHMTTCKRACVSRACACVLRKRGTTCTTSACKPLQARGTRDKVASASDTRAARVLALGAASAAFNLADACVQ
eukprot:1159045-Pelagomonas_calceolata.AAC.14